MVRIHCPLMGVLFVSLLACTDGPRPGRTAALTDSAGILIVENSGPAWNSREGWCVQDSPVLDIGTISGPEPYQLFDVVSARQLSDGRLVIANGATAELRFYDRDGGHVTSAGGTGEGPGELRRLEALFVTPGDSIIAYGRQVVSLFDADGAYLHRFRMNGTAPEGLLALRAVGLLGSQILVLSALPDYWRLNFIDGVNREPAVFATFAFEAQSVDSLGTYPGYETYVRRTGQGVNQQVYPFGKMGHIAAHDESILIADNRNYVLEIRDVRGQLRTIIRVQRPVIPVTNELLAQWIDERLKPYEDATRQQRAQWAQDFRNSPVAETVPAFRSVQIDRDGNIWVEDYELNETRKTYQVLTADGIWLGGVDMPEAVEPLDIGHDYVVGLWRDSVDVEHVRLYELVKPNAERFGAHQ